MWVRISVKRDTAEYLNSLILEFSSRLSDSVGVVKEKCSKDEVEAYLKPVSQMLALGSMCWILFIGNIQI